MFPSTFLATAALVSSLLSSQVAANWDEATGYVYDVRPTCEWQANNTPTVITKAIQVAECYRNTRLPFPKVQRFAWFQHRHEYDHYHGCPYGDCWAYETFPQPDELEVAFTESYVFYWHHCGGVEGGSGPNPIADPQTGAFGYETSLNGQFHDGAMNTESRQPGHDNNYPGGDTCIHPAWSEDARRKYASLIPKNQPRQPKCGRPDDPNYDPGSVKGAYGNYVAAKASEYQPPQPYNGGSVHNSNCSANSPTTNPKHHGHQGNPVHQGNPAHQGNHGHKGNHNTTCNVYCKCIAGCKQGDSTCLNDCKDKHKSCSSHKCGAGYSGQSDTVSQPVSLVRRHAKRAGLH